MLLDLFKGWFGEKATQVGLWMNLDSDVYPRLHDVIVPSANGTTQIDHVLISVYGVFVVETKDYRGWIFGDEHSPKWTVSHFGKKFQFQNPLRQNYRHICCLSEYLKIDAACFHSVVFFIGEAELKTTLPRNVLTSGLSTYIRSFSNPVLTPTRAGEILTSLMGLKNDPTLTRARHLTSLEVRHSSTTVCPKCGSALVQRTARTGPNIGRSFLGCQSFPRCRFTKQM